MFVYSPELRGHVIICNIHTRSDHTTHKLTLTLSIKGYDIWLINTLKLPEETQMVPQ